MKNGEWPRVITHPAGNRAVAPGHFPFSPDILHTDEMPAFSGTASTGWKTFLEAVKGRPVSVREALALINATLDEVLARQEGDFDADTRFAIAAWFERHG